jgi:hypothetical protein
MTGFRGDENPGLRARSPRRRWSSERQLPKLDVADLAVGAAVSPTPETKAT